MILSAKKFLKMILQTRLALLVD